MTHDEQTVLQRIQNGETSAFREFVELYKKKVYYLALDYTGNHHDAEDMSQEVFMKAFASIKDFRGDSKVSSWLYRITVNTCLDRARRKPLQLVELNEEVIQSQPHSKTNPEQEIHRKRTKERIDAALQQLPPKQRSIFVLRHYNELSLKDIAEVLGVAEGTVKAQLFRAIKKLQKELSPFHKPQRGSSDA
jgi:RNA polymerase sigma-70 factor (ECF subfamily)